MRSFIVLISRHERNSEHTTQFDFIARAIDRVGARGVAILRYPPAYIRFWEDGKYLGLVAHFTGEIYGT